MWKQPWRYKESFVVSLLLLILGFIIEFINKGKEISFSQFPANLIIGLLFISLLLAIHFFFQNKAIVKWLSSVPAAISAISLFSLITLLLGFIPQDTLDSNNFIDLIGLTHLKQSWVIIIAEIYLLVSLGLVSLNRSKPFTGKNIGFLLNHAGLWLTLVAATLGSGDLQRLKVALDENGKFVNLAFKEGHKFFILPYSLKLLDFNIEMYNPGIFITDTMNESMDQNHGVILPLIEKGSEYTLKDWKINVIEMLPKARKTDTGYVEFNSHMSASAAYICVINNKTGDSTKGWLCSGNMMEAPKYLQIGGSNVINIKKPEPRKYASTVVFMNKNGKMDTVLIQVNKPYKTRGWSFYQQSYDEKMGHSTKVSIIEAVYDPWLPLVYLGVLLMIAGSIYIFWLGRSIKSEEL
jgi:hypothetical protein